MEVQCGVCYNKTVIKKIHFRRICMNIGTNIYTLRKEKKITQAQLAEKLGVEFQPDVLTGPYQPVVDKIEDEHIRKVRICLKKNKELTSNKARLIKIINEFEAQFRYTGHISLNVDPS